MFRCGICECSYTAERKVKPSGKEYIYYHCTGKGKIKTCKKDSYISEGKIDKFIVEILKDLENIPQELIDEVKDSLKVKNNYSNTTQDNIYKRIKEIDKMIQNGYKRMLKSSDSTENELWNQAYKELKAEKEQFLDK